MNTEDLLTCLQTFSTTHDNAARAAIEAQMESGWQASAARMMLSMQAVIVNATVAPQLRSLAAVLLRRGMGKSVGGSNATSSSALLSVSLMDRRAVVEGLLSVLQQPSLTADLANKVADAVSEAVRLSESSSNNGDFSAVVMSFIGNSLQQQQQPQSTILLPALRILEGAPSIITTPDQHRQAASLLASLLQRPESTVVVTAAVMRAVVSLLMSISDADKKAYGECLKVAISPIVAKRLVDSLVSSDDDESVSDFLSAVIDGVIEAPKMFKGDLAVEYYNFGLLITTSTLKPEENDDVDVGVCSLGIELSLCLLEQLTGQFKKRSDCIQSGMNVIVQMMCRVEDCKEWYEADGPDADEDIDEVAILGEQCIDRFAIALTGRHLAQPLFTLVSSLLQSPSWNHRYGGLKAIASTAEGLMDVLEDQLPQVLSLIWPAFSHSHPRVQYAACHAIGQLCTDFDGAIQRDHTKASLECLVGVLSRSSVHRVQQHAAAALVNFAEGVDAGQLSPFLDGILGRLVELLRVTNKSALQQQLIATIAAFSSAAESLFTKYLDSLMPVLMTCCASPDRLLQCRAVEAMSIFALAVGRLAFFENPHGSQFMAFLTAMEKDLNNNNNNSNTNDQPQTSSSSQDQMAEYLQTAWVRMCQVLGADFAPYLQCCLPRMIKQAQAEADVAVLDADADHSTTADQYDENEWDFAEINGRRYGIHTAGLEEKCAALENIAAIAGTMGAAFGPFTEDCLFNLAVPLLEFDLHDGVESAAADLCAACLQSMVSANQPSAQSAAVQCLAKLVETAKSKYSPDYSTAAIDAINTVFGEDKFVFAETVVKEVLERVEVVARFAVKRVLETASQDDQEDGNHEDDQDNDNEGVDDAEVFYAVARLYATACRRYHLSNQPQLLSLLKLAITQLDSKRRRPMPLMHAAVCMLVDAVQWMPVIVAQQCDVPAILKWCLSSGQDRDIRQAAVFGCGVVGESGQPVFEPFMITIVPLLLQMLTSTAKTASNAVILDNVVSALIKAMTGYPSIRSKQSDIVPILVSSFPITADQAEFNCCYGFLERLFQEPQWQPLLVKPAILESLLEACCGPVSKHLSSNIKEALKVHLPDLVNAVGPQCGDLMSRYDMSLCK